MKQRISMREASMFELLLRKVLNFLAKLRIHSILEMVQLNNWSAT